MPAREKNATDREPVVDRDLVKAIGHPVRMRLLARLNERVASPVELARELGESVQLVSYHVRILRELEFVELVSTTPRRGAVEHHYRATRRAFVSDADYAAMPKDVRAELAGVALERILGQAVEAHAAGVFADSVDSNLSAGDFILDEQAWRQLTEKVAEVVEYAMELQAEAAPRLQDGAEPVTARVNVLLYPKPAGSAKR